MYFLTNYQEWEAAFGYDPRISTTVSAAIVCRNGQQVRSTNVKTFPAPPCGWCEGYISGRHDPQAENDFETGDIILPAGMAFPPSLPQTTITPVSVTQGPDVARTVSAGKLFFFDNSAWEQVFEFPTWGDCPDSFCSTTTVTDGNLAHCAVRQCPNGSEVWNGVVATSVNHYDYPGQTSAVGRRLDGAAGDFESDGDTIILISRTCS